MIQKRFFRTFSLEQMTSRKITVDNSLKYIPQSEQTQERDSKPNTIKNNSLPRKQNINSSKNNKNLLNT